MAVQAAVRGLVSPVRPLQGDFWIQEPVHSEQNLEFRKLLKECASKTGWHQNGTATGTATGTGTAAAAVVRDGPQEIGCLGSQRGEGVQVGLGADRVSSPKSHWPLLPR